jgi:hypothetical protein
MPLPKQTMDLPLSVALDTKSDPKVARGLLAIKNGEMRSTGLVKKRRAFAPLGNRSANGGVTATDSVGYRPTESRFIQGYGLYSVGSRLLLAGRDELTQSSTMRQNLNNGDVISSYAPAIDKWTPQAAMVPCSTRVRRGGDPLDADRICVAVGGGYRVVVLRYGVGSYLFTPDSYYVFVIDDKTNDVIWKYALVTGAEVQGYFIDTNTGPQFLGFTGGRIIFWDTATPHIAPTELVPADGGSNVACCLSNDKKSVWCAFTGNAGFHVKVVQYGAGGAALLGPTSTVAATVFATAQCIFSNMRASGVEELIVCFQVQTTGAFGIARFLASNASIISESTADVATFPTANWANVTGTPITMVSAGALLDGSFIIGVETNTATVEDRLVKYVTYKFDATQVGGTSRNIQHFSLVSNMFTHNGRAYTLGIYDTALQSTLLLYSFHSIDAITAGLSDDLHVPQLVTKTLVGRGGDVRYTAVPSSNPKLCSFMQRPGTNTWVTGGQRLERIITNAQITSAVAIEFTLGDAPAAAVPFGKSGVLPGGVVENLDGGLAELNFHIYPENLTVADGGAGGPLQVGNYSYIVVAEWTDKNGQIHRSSTSVAKTLAVAIAAHKGSITVRTLFHTSVQKLQNPAVTIIVYRTELNGTAYYRCKSTTFRFTDAVNYAAILDDTMADATLISQERLYTDAGTLEPIAPPAGNIMAASSDRLFIVPFDDPTTVWYTKPKEEAYAPEFVDGQYVRIDNDGENTGLAILDGQQIVFKERAIYAFVGEGPNALGQGTFSTPRKLASDVGTIDFRSVLVYGNGVLFRSEAGWYILDRSLQTQPVGLPITKYNDFAVAAACVVASLQQVWIALKDTPTLLVFDYIHNQWYVQELDKNIVGMTNLNGLVHILYRDGTVAKYDITKAAEVALFLSTPWYKGGSLQGLQRVWWLHLLGDLDASFKVTIFYDYKDGTSDYQQVKTFPAKKGRKLVRIKPAKRKCIAFRLDIEQTGKLSLDIGLNALTVAFAPLGRLARLASAETK